MQPGNFHRGLNFHRPMRPPLPPGYDPAVGLDLLRQSGVAVIGYGSQGRAHCANLRDSGVPVIVGLYEQSRSAEQARADGFETRETGEAAASAPVVSLCVPDALMVSIFEQSIDRSAASDATIIFAHGYAVRFGGLRVGQDRAAALVAPKGPGAKLRELYLRGFGLAAFVACEQEHGSRTRTIAAGYAAGLGCDRIGLYETTFAEETESDLFGEQTVLCGGMPELLRAAFETLTRAGISPEAAYYECVLEARFIIELIAERGVAGMRAAISDTAAWGGLNAGPNIIDAAVRDRMAELLAAIRSGKFAAEWDEQTRAGKPALQALMKAEATSELQKAHEQLFGAESQATPETDKPR